MAGRSVLLIGSMLAPLLTPVQTLAQSRAENHIITSIILADAGFPADREVLVDLPDGYDSSGLNYPVVYMLHGLQGAASPADMASARSSAVRYINSNQIRPIIVVRPSVGRQRRERSPEFERYLAREVVPFVDASYRTRSPVAGGEPWLGGPGEQ